MQRRYFFIGRAERIIIALLCLLIMTAVALSALTIGPESTQTNPVSLQHSDSLLRSRDYVGPPVSSSYTPANKFTKRTILDLNRVDSLTLLRVPGIGPAFAHRILSLRQRLGGYYTVLQLQEVYGMNEDKFLSLRGWFAIKTLPVRYLLDSLRPEEVPLHPYLSWTQRKALQRLLYRRGHISRWSQILKDSAFNKDDSTRLSHYFIECKQADSLHSTEF